MSLAERLREACAEQGISLRFEGQLESLPERADCCEQLDDFLERLSAEKVSYDFKLTTSCHNGKTEYYLICPRGSLCGPIVTVYPTAAGDRAALLRGLLSYLRALAARSPFSIALPAELESAVNDDHIALLYREDEIEKTFMRFPANIPIIASLEKAKTKKQRNAALAEYIDCLSELYIKKEEKIN